uniref:Uncharacterized protein n=1 Tax=Romanomermis culicivorax TaxID=13658 RepID=A0A915I072_ROMCU
MVKIIDQSPMFSHAGPNVVLRNFMSSRRLFNLGSMASNRSGIERMDLFWGHPVPTSAIIGLAVDGIPSPAGKSIELAFDGVPSPPA